MRTFIAIELPEQIRQALAKLQDELKKSGADVKWVAPENIHLTLKFLGEVNEEKLEKIKQILEEVATSKNPYLLKLATIGAFPTLNSPRVIWIGVVKGDAETKSIAQELEEKIAQLGIPKEERLFSSHITLGRTRSTLNRLQLVEKLNQLGENFSLENGEFTVTRLTLFKSTLTPKGSLYEVLKPASLKTT